MTKKIFKNIFFSCLAVLFATILIVFEVLYNFYGEELMNQLHMEVNSISAGVQQTGINYLNTVVLADSQRITWVDSDGKVIFDSDAFAEEMTNHLDREEIKEALADGEGEAIRYSNTLSERTMYCAKLLDDGTIIRVSTNQYTTWVLLIAMLQPFLVVLVIALIISYAIAYFSSRKIVTPINNLDLENTDDVEVYEEIRPLVKKIRNQNRVIKEQINELKRTQAEFNTITGNMEEGLVVVDKNGKVLFYNKSAKRMMNVITADEVEYLEDFETEGKFTENIKKALAGEHISETTTYYDKFINIYCNPVVVDGKIKGAVAVILDITEKHQREMLRKEFSANVSHELKTPLTAILASAEIISMESTPKKTDIHFSQNIMKESNRLITLVNDIIKLSKLDDKSVMFDTEYTDLYTIAQNVVDSLNLIAESANVTLELHGEKTMIHGAPSLLSEIVYNLVDNAIKYNKDNGKVIVTVAPFNGKAQLIVEDTGIGISKDDQNRIFERFYRVDKSRSKEVGGTGLGLSIVKNGIRQHNGELKIESAVGKGTKITVIF